MMVDIEKLRDAVAYIDLVNSAQLDRIEWVNAVDSIDPIEPSAGAIRQWKFIGLSNAEFAKQYIL
jgi:hypothetical protein